MINYRGDVSWIQISAEGWTAANDVPQRTYVYEGRADQTSAFLATFPVTSQRLGGYVIRRIDRELQGPFNQVEVVIAYPPSFHSVAAPTSWEIKTVTRSAILNNSDIVPGFASFNLRREIIYRSPSTQFFYFASERPNGPRHTSAIGTIRRERDLTTIQGFDADGNLRQTAVFTFSQLITEFRAELQLQEQSRSEVQATPIDGTPWWRCVDTATREYQPDPEMGGS